MGCMFESTHKHYSKSLEQWFEAKHYILAKTQYQQTHQTIA